MWVKSLLSKPKVIFTTDSSYSGTINVLDQQGSLVLEVGGYPQSVSLNAPGLAKRYWSRAVDEVANRLENPKRVLVIGVGGATIPHLLARKFPGLELVGVELDPKIVEVARRFFGLDKVPNFTVVVEDGAKYLAAYQGEKFDLIFVDAYLGGSYPSQFEEEGFLNIARSRLAPQGLAVFNRTSGSNLKAFAKLLGGSFARIERVKIPLPGFLGGLGGNFLFFCA